MLQMGDALLVMDPILKTIALQHGPSSDSKVDDKQPVADSDDSKSASALKSIPCIQVQNPKSVLLNGKAIIRYDQVADTTAVSVVCQLTTLGMCTQWRGGGAAVVHRDDVGAIASCRTYAR